MQSSGGGNRRAVGGEATLSAETIYDVAAAFPHIASFLSTATYLLFVTAIDRRFSPASGAEAGILSMQAADEVMSLDEVNNYRDWKIIIDSSITAESATSSNLSDNDVFRMLSLVNNDCKGTLKYLSLTDVKVDGTGLEPLMYSTELKHLDLKSLTHPPRHEVFIKVVSMVVDLIAHKKLKYLGLPPRWLEMAVRLIEFHGGRNVFRCVGSCCVNSEEVSSSCAREWCHQCEYGPCCEDSPSLVYCKARNITNCKSCWGSKLSDTATRCTLECKKWHCACGCKDGDKETCFDCGDDFFCCFEKCHFCSKIFCLSCMEEGGHYRGYCMRVCDACDEAFHESDVQISFMCGCYLCPSCTRNHVPYQGNCHH